MKRSLKEIAGLAGGYRRISLFLIALCVYDNTLSTHTYLVHTEAHTHAHTRRSAVCGCHKGESSQHGCCCAVTATSTAP